MEITETKGIHAYVGGPSWAAALLALVVALFAATPASAATTSPTRAQSDPLAVLSARGVVLHPGAGFRRGGSPVVRDLQRLLTKAGYSPGPVDGRYGPLTAGEVMRYQANYGLQVDGIAGPQTLTALTARAAAVREGAGYATTGSPVVRQLQRLLARAGYSPGPIDGRFGPRTERAVRRYQTSRGFRVSGIAGPQTFAELRSRGGGTQASGGRSSGSPAPAASGPTTPTPTTPKATPPAATTPTSTAPATPAPAAGPPPTARHTSHPSGGTSLLWILLVALLILALPVGLLLYLRRRRGGHGKGVVVPRALLGPGAPAEPEAAAAEDAGDGHAPAEPFERPPPEVVPGTNGAAAAATTGAAGAGVNGAAVAGTNGHAPAETNGHAPAETNGHAPAETDGAAVPGAHDAATNGTNRSASREIEKPEVDGRQHDADETANSEAGDTSLALTDTSAVFELGLLLEGKNDLPAAEAAYRRADNLGHGPGATHLGVLLEGKGNRDRAEAAYRRADERGDENGAFNLGVLLEANDDLAGAEAAYRRADWRGHGGAASNLGVLLEGRGDRNGAEAAYRRADDRGEANGAFNLGVLLEENGDLAGAEAAYRRAEQSGDGKVAELAHAAVLELVPAIANPGADRNGGTRDGT